MKTTVVTIQVMITVAENGEVRVDLTKGEGPNETFIEKEPDRIAIKPKYIFACKRYHMKVGRKEIESCFGCTVQCHMKGHYKGPPVEIGKSET